MKPVIFTVAGDPVPQPRPKVCRRGAFVSTYTPDNGIHAYRQAVQLLAKAAGATPTEAAPLVMWLELVFERPPSHFHTSKKRKGELKHDAKKLPRADSSNCLKGVEDALNGVAYVDDSQIGTHYMVRRYATPGEVAHTTVTITEGVVHAAERAIENADGQRSERSV
jgi:Holliday junction resolvase RusA-like endonuclease